MMESAAVNASAWEGALHATSPFPTYGFNNHFQASNPIVYCQLLREVFGNPFRRFTPDPTWLSATLVSLAEAAYADRPLPDGHLDSSRLPVLADALEDAGCNNAEILAHCRGPGPHVRGCWIVDLLLGNC
jgi:hypothetical protein